MNDNKSLSNCEVKVSIGLAIYNVDKYLENCLISIIGQSLRDIEIILVDDGSTDTSGCICDQYAAKDNRIKVIHKTNGGLASARQAALEKATGKYFCACDADDWVEKDMYEKLYYKAEETGADIVMCDYFVEYGNGVTKTSHYGKEISSNNDSIINDALMGIFPCSVWSKLFNRNIFEKHRLFWEQGINMGEDFLMMLKIMQHPVKMTYHPECLYHYRRMPGEDSYTNKVTLSSYNQMLRIQDWIETYFERILFGKGIDHYLINIAFAGLRVEDGMTASYYKQTSTNRLSISSLLKEHSLKSFVILWTKLLGYKAGFWVYKSFYKIVYK